MRHHRRHPNGRPGITMPELLAILVAFTLLMLLAMPIIRQARSSSGLEVSLANLATIGAAHAVYAADWNDRQFTNIDDEISTYGDSADEALSEWNHSHGGCAASHEFRSNCAASVLLGHSDSSATIWGYWTWLGVGNFQLTTPIVALANTEFDFGVYRMVNADPLHDYLGGRVYDPVFYAPNDHIPYDEAGPGFKSQSEYFPDLKTHVLSSYCFSPAAMFDPDVMRARADGGFQDPWLIDHGFRSPAFSAATYPDLKTNMLEHHWVQNAPQDRCNPDMDSPWYSCAPYFFNHSIESEPASLFYDLHVQVLPNRKVQEDDQRVLKQTGGVDGLWSRDTLRGPDGYFLEYAFDPDVDVSHHIFTTDGILGRDRLSP